VVVVIVVVVVVFFTAAIVINVAIVPIRASKMVDSNKQGSRHPQQIDGVHLSAV